ncbi:MAG: PAS domain S-box protein [Candidatus Manganitrophus sp. SB1]|nr:PAS domain S-box protein [Candidatus Manganitrophus morganii]
MKGPRPEEGAGLNARHGPAIVNILSEETFDDLTRLAAQLCSAPIAFIHVIENNQHYIKSGIGLEPQANPPDLPFFSHAILQSDVFIVSDVSIDPRFSTDPRVRSGPLRFYAGVPLMTDRGEVVGTLSVMGPTPKVLHPDQIESLRTAARQVTCRFNLRIQLAELKQSTQEGKLFRERLAAEHAITHVLAQSKTLSDAVPKILRIVCESLGWTIGIFWRVSDQVSALTCVETWQAPSANGSDFEASSREMIFEPNEGLPGQVWSHGEPTWIIDAAEEPLLARASLAAKEGLHGAFAFPVRGQNKILGVMEFFCSGRKKPDDSLLEMMSNVGSQIGQFMARKQAEETLVQWAAIVESSEDAIIGKTLDGIITSWNSGAEKIFGYSSEEVLDQPISILFPPERLNEFQEIQDRIAQGEPVTHSETVRVRKDGKRIDVSMTVSPIRDNAGKVVGISSIKRDITGRKEMEKALRESEARKGAILESSLDCIITIDHEGKIVEFNPAAENTFGYCRADVIGKEMAELIIPPALRERHRAGLAHCLAAKGKKVLYRRIEMTAMRADGSEFPSEVTITRIPLDGPPLFTGYVRDISERKRTEEERDRFLMQERVARAQAEEARRHMAFLAEASTLLSSSLDYEATLSSVARLAVPYLADGCAVDILEEDQTVRRLAVAASDPSKEKIGKELINRYPPDPGGKHPLQRVLRTGKPIFLPEITDAMLASVAQNEAHLRIGRSLGLTSAIIVPLLARGRTLGAISFVLTDSGRRYRPADLILAEDLARRVGMAVDNARLYRAAQEEIKERKRMEDHLQFLASHDTLTHLPNRVVFTDRLNQAVERARRYPKLIAVFFLDLDGFKGINDSFGHAIGDRLLKEMAERLTHSTRRSDTVARLGGDEFTLIIPDLSEAQNVTIIAQNIVNALAEPFSLEGYLFSVTASIGISLYPRDGTDAETLLQKADQAMYRAKKQGGNLFRFYSPPHVSDKN